MAQAVQTSGLPVPTVGNIIHVNQCHGLLYQRVEGISMLMMMSRHPWQLHRYARQMAELHVAMHKATVSADMPSQRQKLSHKIGRAPALTNDLRIKALAALETMPSGNQLCHGDFHPDNILLTEQGGAIIDWMDGSLGNPLADVARTTIILRGAMMTRQIAKVWQKTAVAILCLLYLRHYFALRPGGKAEYAGWLPLVAAARLSENIPELEAWLLAQVEKGL
jgi:aminoglycoside phosphotransferase (APT) family kinase protein